MLNSLRAKIFLLFAFGLSLILIFFMYYLSHEVYNRFDHLYHQQATTAAKKLGLKTENLYRMGLYPNELFRYEELCQEIVLNNDSVAYAALVDNQGNVLYEAGTRQNRTQKMTYIEKIIDADHGKTITYSLTHPSGKETAILLEIDHQYISQQIKELIQKILFFGFTIAATSLIFILFYLRRNLAIPINQLVTYIKTLDTDQLAPNNMVLLERKDEIGIVATAFNNLISRLYNSQHAFKKANTELNTLTSELEARVKQRTVELSKANERLDRLARTDALTGLGNRHQFMEIYSKRFKHAQRHRHNFAILMIDFNNFKYINDTFGHAAGDLTLKEIGKRLLNALRTSDYSFRIGGDEFILLIEEYNTVDDLKSFIEKIQTTISEPIKYQKNTLSLGASIGISCLENHKKIESHTLLSLADIAMYKAKRQGGGYLFS